MSLFRRTLEHVQDEEKSLEERGAVLGEHIKDLEDELGGDKVATKEMLEYRRHLRKAMEFLAEARALSDKESEDEAARQLRMASELLKDVEMHVEKELGEEHKFLRN